MTVAPIADPQTDKRGNVVSFIILVCFLNSFYLFSCVRAKCYTGLFSDCPGPRFATRTCSHHPPWRQVHRPHTPNNRWISRSWMSPKHLSSLLSFCKFLKLDWRTRSIRAAACASTSTRLLLWKPQIYGGWKNWSSSISENEYPVDLWGILRRHTKGADSESQPEMWYVQSFKIVTAPLASIVLLISFKFVTYRSNK